MGDCGWLGESVSDLLEDSSSDSWAAGTGRRLDDKAGFGQQAPTLESMLLRMEEIQVRVTLQGKTHKKVNLKE